MSAYKVNKGDTLWSIASREVDARYGSEKISEQKHNYLTALGVTRIAKSNFIKDPNFIREDSMLLLLTEGALPPNSNQYLASSKSKDSAKANVKS